VAAELAAHGGQNPVGELPEAPGRETLGESGGDHSGGYSFVDGREYRLPLRPEYLKFAIDDEVQWKKEKGWHFAANPAARKVAKGK